MTKSYRTLEEIPFPAGTAVEVRHPRAGTWHACTVLFRLITEHTGPRYDCQWTMEYTDGHGITTHPSVEDPDSIRLLP